MSTAGAAEEDDKEKATMCILSESGVAPSCYGAMTRTGSESVSLSTLLADMPLKPFHLWATLFFAVAKGSVGSLYEMSPLVLKLVAAEFDLDGPRVALVSTILVGGGLVGSIIAAPIADLAGRWWTLMLFSSSALVVGLCQGILIGPLRSYVLLLLLRAMLGVSYGAILCTAQSYLAELLPKANRGVLVACVGLGWQVSRFYCLLVVYLVPTRWRMCLTLSAVPFFLVVMGMLFWMPESPRWLILTKQKQKAKAVLNRLGADLPVPEEVIVEERVTAEKLWVATTQWRSEVRQLFRSGNVETTLLVWVLWICVSSCWYTASVWTPALLMHMLRHDTPPTKPLAILNFANMVVHLLVALVIDHIGRKPVAVFSFAAASVLLISASLLPPDQVASTLLIAGNVVLDTAWIPIGLISIEFFPTSCRVTAISMCMVLVRVSASVVPTFLGMVCFESDSSSISSCLGSIAVIAAVGAGSAVLLPPDATNAALPDVSGHPELKMQRSTSLLDEPRVVLAEAK